RVEPVVQHDLRAELREGARRDPWPPLSRGGRPHDVPDVLRVRAPQGLGDRRLERAARRGTDLNHHAQSHAARGGLARRLRQDVRAPGEEVAMRLSGKVALVSGGASGQAMFVKLDVSKEAEWEKAVKAAVDAFGKLDVLVNNAGISGTFDQDMLSTTAWDKLMDINAKGVFLGMKTAIPAMQRAGGGAIVNISSISGFVGQNGVHMAYNASKGAVRIMTKTAAVQFAQHGIRVNSVHPGMLPPMRSSKGSADPTWREKMIRAVPMKREGRVEEVAHA